MAKALLGHVGGPDPRIVSEMRRLQLRSATSYSWSAVSASPRSPDLST